MELACLQSGLSRKRRTYEDLGGGRESRLFFRDNRRFCHAETLRVVANNLKF